MSADDPTRLSFAHSAMGADAKFPSGSSSFMTINAFGLNRPNTQLCRRIKPMPASRDTRLARGNAAPPPHRPHPEEPVCPRPSSAAFWPTPRAPRQLAKLDHPHTLMGCPRRIESPPRRTQPYWIHPALPGPETLAPTPQRGNTTWPYRSRFTYCTGYDKTRS